MFTVDDVRRMLSDVCAWRGMMSDAVDTILGVSASRLTFTTNGLSAGGSLEGKIAAITDDDSLGALGVRTEAGLLAVLRSWAKSFAEDRGEAVTDTWSYLSGVLNWAYEHADWEAFADDVAAIHARLASLTGHAPLAIGWCFRVVDGELCGARIVAEQTESGRADCAVCSSCGAWYSDGEDVSRKRQLTAVEAARNCDDDTVLVSFKELVDIWSGVVGKNTLKSWTHRGHIRPVSNERLRLYRLAEVNRVVKTRLG